MTLVLQRVRQLPSVAVDAELKRGNSGLGPALQWP